MVNLSVVMGVTDDRILSCFSVRRKLKLNLGKTFTSYFNVILKNVFNSIFLTNFNVVLK